MGRVYACGHTLIGTEKKGGLTLGTGDKNREDRSDGRSLRGMMSQAWPKAVSSSPSLSVPSSLPSASTHTQPHTRAFREGLL